MSLIETKQFAERIAQEIQSSPAGAGAIVYGFVGDLGSGKTTLVKLLGKELGVAREIVSPSFLIMRPYETGLANLPHLIHIDAYRLKSSDELLNLGFRDILKDPKNLVVIEWANRVKDILPKETRWVTFAHGEKENERRITIN